MAAQNIEPKLATSPPIGPEGLSTLEVLCGFFWMEKSEVNLMANY